jgi:hypothetical protein
MRASERATSGSATVLFNLVNSKVAGASSEERFICSASQTREANKLSASSLSTAPSEWRPNTVLWHGLGSQGHLFARVSHDHRSSYSWDAQGKLWTVEFVTVLREYSTVFPEKLMLIWSRNSPPSMELEVSLPSHHTPSLIHHPSSPSTSPKWSVSLKFFNKNFVYIYFMCATFPAHLVLFLAVITCLSLLHSLGG